MILETLSKIIHPAADKDIVSLGLVEDIKEKRLCWYASSW